MNKVRLRGERGGRARLEPPPPFVGPGEGAASFLMDFRVDLVEEGGPRVREERARRGGEVGGDGVGGEKVMRRRESAGEVVDRLTVLCGEEGEEGGSELRCCCCCDSSESVL